jgi:hypothetical protein
MGTEAMAVRHLEIKLMRSDFNERRGVASNRSKLWTRTLWIAAALISAVVIAMLLQGGS